MVLHAIRIGFGHRFDPKVGGIVAQLLVMEKVIHRVKAKPINAAVQPEPHVFDHPVLHSRVVEIPIRLLHQKVMQVILFAPRIPSPGAAAKHRQPIVGRRAIGFRIGPDKPVGFRVVAAGAADFEKRVLIGTM